MVEHSSSTETPHHEPRLSRQLGLTTATALVVAEVIGVGIFLTTAGMVKSLGSPFWLLPVWLTTGVAAAGGAICFGALAARRPEAGGAYVYFTVPTVVFVGLTVAAVFVLGRGARNTEEPVPVPWHPIPPLLFLVPTAVLLALMAMNKPKHAGIGLAVVLLGLPVYHLVFTRLAPREAPGDASSLAESSPASAAVETT